MTIETSCKSKLPKLCNMKQTTLFETFDTQRLTATARARRTDEETSHEAAAFMSESGSAKAQAEKILAVVRAEPGLTAPEIGERVGLTSVQVTKRFENVEKFVKYGPKRKVNGHPTSFNTWWPK